MYSLFLNRHIGLSTSLDFEDYIQIKFLNVATLLFSSILYFFIVFHLFITHKYYNSAVLILFAFGVSTVFIFQKKKQYSIAKFIFFFLLLIFLESMFIIPGKGGEYFYLSIVILLLTQTKKIHWLIILISLNAILFILSQVVFAPYPKENYSYVTAITVFVGIVLSVRFFIMVQKKIQIFGSTDCIDKIVSNLLSNTIKYSHSDSKIIIGFGLIINK